MNLIKKNKNEDILSKIKGKDTKNFEYIINFITDSKYYFEKLKKINNSQSTANINPPQINSEINNKTELSSSSLSLNSSRINENKSYYKILKFEKYLENNSSQFIRQMNNGLSISIDSDDSLYVYRKNLGFIKYISTNEIINNFNTEVDNNIIEGIKQHKKTQNIIETNESIKNKNTNMFQIIDCSKSALLIYNIKVGIYNNRINIDFKKNLNLSCTGCIEINNNNNINYIVYGENGLFHFENNFPILNKDNIKNYRITKIPFKGGIKIDDNYIILTSNRILANGEDKLIFYDIKDKKILKKKEIKESFINDINGLTLMDIEENKKSNKILLCACKKYIENQKNGILLMNPNLEINKNLSYNFVDTDDFEVNCFCPLMKKERNNIIKYNLFLVGGFEKNKKTGMIRLYRVIYNDETNFDIEFLQDILIDKTEDFEGFKRTVNCIIQDQNNGRILVNTWEGKIYLFSEPNLDYYFDDNDSNITELLKKYSSN